MATFLRYWVQMLVERAGRWWWQSYPTTGSRTHTIVLWTPYLCYAVLVLHRHRERVSEELGFGLELVDDAGHVRGKNVAQGGYELSGAIRSERWEW